MSMRQVVKERPAVVLLHASASSARQWDALVVRLQPRFRPIAIELNGQDDATTVARTIERLGGAHVVGHSYGGAVAMMVASSRRSAYVRSLALFEPVLFRALLADPASNRETQDVLTVAEFIRLSLARNDPEAAAQRFMEYWSGADAWRYLGPARQATIAARMPEVLANFDALFDKSFDAPALARLRRPMLFLAGARTVASTRRLATLLGDAFPAATHEVLPDMGHMGPVTHPEPVNERIEQFLVACENDANNAIAHAGPRLRAMTGNH
jgi:pimeloyl-ACP methyl ester carboxylesterase